MNGAVRRAGRRAILGGMRAAPLVVAALLASAPVAYAQGQPAAPHEAAPGAIRVLLVGNSLTYSNDMPAMLERMAAAAGPKRLFVGFSGGPGMTLRQHWEAGAVARAAAERRWDCVVLQGQSQEPVAATDEFLSYGQLLDGEIRRRGARTVLFVTWAARGQSQAPLTAAYESLARATGATVAPVGAAWERARRRGVTLHDAGGVHPNAAGTYLAACVLYAVVAGVSPVGLPFPSGPGMTPAFARELQETAWEAARASR